jgi:hypothetical protein
MIITAVSTVVGFSISQDELYLHCLKHSEKFREIIKTEYIGDDYTFEEFCNFIEAHFSHSEKAGTHNDVSIDMLEMMSDSMIDLERICYPGTELYIYRDRYRREQDVNYESCIVGIEILYQEVRNVTGDGGLEISTVMDMGQKLVNASGAFAAFPELMKYDIKLFTIVHVC